MVSVSMCAYVAVLKKPANVPLTQSMASIEGINWTLEEGKCTVLKASDDQCSLAECAPAIYRQRDGDKRCTVDMRIQQGMHATISSNAKSCEIYGIHEQGQQEYQGFAKAEPLTMRRWKLKVAAKV